jgi:hypothetical protein
MNAVPKLNHIGAQMRVNQLLRRLAEVDFEAAESAIMIREATAAWRAGPGAVTGTLLGDMLYAVEAGIQGRFAGNVLPAAVADALRPPRVVVDATHASVTHGYAWTAPPAPAATLAADLSALHLSRPPTTTTAPGATPAGSTAGIGTHYAPSGRAQRLLAHYEATKDDYAPMAKRRVRILFQEQTAGTQGWQDAMDALYVIGAIVLDQRQGKSGFLLKFFNGDEDYEIVSRAALVQKVNSNKTKPTKIPAFSDNFQTALWDYIRDYDDNRGSKVKIEQESIYLICTGADNDSSDSELREAVEELKQMKLPPKQLCAGAVRIGNDIKGEAKLAALDDPSDASMRDIFDAPHFSSIDPEQVVQTYFDEVGDQVARDMLQKLAMGLFNKGLD